MIRLPHRGMHYCFLLTFGFKSPSSLRMQSLGAALMRSGVRVSYIVNDDGSRAAGHGPPDGAGVEWVPPGSQIATLRARRRAVRRLRPDFVEVLNPHVQTLLPLAGLRGVRVVGLWDEPKLVHNQGLAGRVAARTWNRWLLKRAWLKIVASRELQKMLRDDYGAEATYLPHVTYLSPQPDGPSPFDEPTVVYVGSLYPIWDHDMVFAAAKELGRRGKSPAVAVVGTGPELEQWRAFTRENGLDRVRVVGFLSEAEMWRHMRHAHALLFAMRSTLLNRSRCSSKLLAYAQARRPVIANRVGEAPEILGPDLPEWVEPTAEGFADAIARVVAGPRPADVEYDLKRLSPSVRAAELLEAIRRREGDDGR